MLNDKYKLLKKNPMNLQNLTFSQSSTAGLTNQQEKYLQDFINHYNARTKTSKKFRKLIVLFCLMIKI
jgi:hypothetical protein